MRGSLVLVVLGGLLALVLVGGWSAPWAPACGIRDAEGQLVWAGSTDQVVAVVERPPAEVAEAMRSGPAVSCRTPAVRVTGESKGSRLGLTPTARRLRAEVRDRFGRIPDGGFGPEQPLPGRRPDGAHSRGRAIDLFFRPATDPGMARQGWELANWAVAHAERLRIRTVIYRDRIWTARRSAQGWRAYRFSGPDPDNPVNRHMDHVHIDVA